MIELYEHQKDAVLKLENGNVLVGGVGSGKSLTALAYYVFRECGFKDGKAETVKDLYIITTARKRDTFEWEQECSRIGLFEGGIMNPKITVDSWNNIKKYVGVENAFFIFDEQRVVGYGAWVKAFIKITKVNRWILLSATPGDTWSDYIPLFIANGFYKNKTEFMNRHAVYSRFSKYPKIDHYLETGRLLKLRKLITVEMEFARETEAHHRTIITKYDKQAYDMASRHRWNIYENLPLTDAGETCLLLRRIVNSDPDRLLELRKLLTDHDKAIVFYNFNYELELLRQTCDELGLLYSEWNGHKHEPILRSEDRWAYLVQYNAGAEGWNCTLTDTIIFYSQNYSYKIMVQAAGRIDRMNTPFKDLYYYHLRSNASIDRAIEYALRRKKNFNESKFLK